jgi:hypothetical protein
MNIHSEFRVGALIVRDKFQWYGTVTEIVDDHTVYVLWNIHNTYPISHQMESLINLGWKVISDEKEILQYLLKHD